MDAKPSGAAEVFGAALRALRKRASLSLRQLGQQALYDYTRISRAERGLILIPAPQVRVLDEVLHAGGLLIALRQAAGSLAAGPAGSCSVTGGGPVIVEVRLPGGGSISVSLSRRGFGQLIAAGAVTVAMPGGREPGDTSGPAYAARQPSRVDDQILGYFRRTLAEFYTADKMLGPRSLIGPVLAQVSVLDEMRRGASARYTDPVLQVLAQYGEMAGWLLQDAGDLDAAAGWSARAAQWAQCAGDTNLAAYMLVRQANIALLTGDHAAVVQLAAGARRDQGRLEPKLTALALQQQARGHARLGQFSECFTPWTRQLPPWPRTRKSPSPASRSTCTTTAWERCGSSPPHATSKPGIPQKPSPSWKRRWPSQIPCCSATAATSPPSSPSRSPDPRSPSLTGPPHSAWTSSRHSASSGYSN